MMYSKYRSMTSLIPSSLVAHSSEIYGPLNFLWTWSLTLLDRSFCGGGDFEFDDLDWPLGKGDLLLTLLYLPSFFVFFLSYFSPLAFEVVLYLYELEYTLSCELKFFFPLLVSLSCFSAFWELSFPERGLLVLLCGLVPVWEVLYYLLLTDYYLPLEILSFWWLLELFPRVGVTIIKWKTQIKN